MIESKRLPREMVLNPITERKDSQTFNLWAPPNFWSQWHRVLTLTRPAKVTISAEMTMRGGNEFNIEVKYFDENSRRQYRDFSVLRKFTFLAGNQDHAKPDAQVIAVRLKSSTTGQNIRVRVDT